MRRDKFKRAAWCCRILFAAIGLQSAGTARAEESPTPNVKETSKQLEEVIKLLKQGENPTAAATVEDNASTAKKSDKKTKETAKAKP